MLYIRKAVVAGQFYNNDPIELKREVLAYLNMSSSSSPNAACENNVEHEHNVNHTDNIGQKIDLSHENQALIQNKAVAKMLLLPHAGHVYCGEIIGKTLSQSILSNNIIILCPNHRGIGHNLAVYPNGQWLTPLGAITINSELAHDIIDSHPSFQADTKAHELEHSIEVLIPFIQCHYPNAQIVPISISIYNFQEIDNIAKSLAKVIDNFNNKNSPVSIIVSSDMNHFESHEKSIQKDTLALRELLNCDPEALLNTVAQNNISMCGISPASLGLCTCLYLGTCKAHIVEYTNSAKINNNYDSVVGYCGAIII